MPSQSPDRPLGAFLKALREEKIAFILIGNMAAIVQGAPMMTIDYDFWVRLPERQYVRLLQIVHQQGGTIRSQTLYELSDGTQVNAIFNPDGLRSFSVEYNTALRATLAGESIRVLPLQRIIASKKAAGREKDLAALPALQQTLRLSNRIKKNRQKKSE